MLYISKLVVFFFFFKQKTAYEMRISDWSSDVCSSDLRAPFGLDEGEAEVAIGAESFLFQDGHAEAYAAARYGILKVAPDGSSVLAGLADSERRPIRPCSLRPCSLRP